ncbi:MAG: NAD-dependent epimerase/dehydratase family protein [Proteobacteria bacterium]|nr:NAD-dependent epimerase/dehydratase family protein [Pseudomonadota bacterium]
MSNGAPTLVTGAGGHLGANLIRHLLRHGEPVRALLGPGDDPGSVDGLDVEWRRADLRQPESLRDALSGVRRVYHTAAKVSTIYGNAAHRREIFQCNVLGTKHLLASARAAGVERVVVTGSFSAVGYDKANPSAASDGSIPFDPFEHAMPYERSKVGVEHECLKAVAAGQDVSIATSCAILGGNDFVPSRMGRTLCDYANGRLRAYVDGGFEFVAARDIAEGHRLVMEKGRTGERYIFSTAFATLDEILGHFESASGVPRRQRRLPAPLFAALAGVTSPVLSRLLPRHPQRLTPGAIRLLRLRRHADVSKSERELGYRPTSIAAAIEEAYAFFYERGAIVNPAARAPKAPVPVLDRATA